MTPCGGGCYDWTAQVDLADTGNFACVADRGEPSRLRLTGVGAVSGHFCGSMPLLLTTAAAQHSKGFAISAACDAFK